MGTIPVCPTNRSRAHVLAAAIRVAETILRSHGYPDPTRSLEILHVAIEDADAPT